MLKQPTYGEMLVGTIFKSTRYSGCWFLLKKATTDNNDWIEMTFLEKDRIITVSRYIYGSPDYEFWKVLE